MSATPLPARPSATTSTSTAGYGTKWPCRAELPRPGPPPATLPYRGQAGFAGSCLAVTSWRRAGLGGAGGHRENAVGRADYGERAAPDNDARLYTYAAP